MSLCWSKRREGMVVIVIWNGEDSRELKYSWSLWMIWNMEVNVRSGFFPENLVFLPESGHMLYTRVFVLKGGHVVVVLVFCIGFHTLVYNFILSLYWG